MLNTITYSRCCTPTKTAPGRKKTSASPQTSGDTFSPSNGVSGGAQEPKILLNIADFTAKNAVSAATNLVQSQKPAPPNADIKDVQAQLTRELPDVKVKFLHTDTFGELNGRLATEAELTAMIEALQDESNIPFGYIKDGCYARAHLMDESFRQHDMNYAKMFVRGDLAAENDHMEARWWYHVAPLVFMDDGEGNPVSKIIDPGFSDKPMNPEDWVKAMNQGPSIEVDLVAPEQYFPRRFSKPDTFAESLSPAVSRMQSYADKLHHHRRSAGEDMGDFEMPTWDTPGCGGDFMVDGECKSMFPDGVNTGRSRIYYGHNDINGGKLVDFELPEVEAEVSAAWENRPTDFDPYNS